MNILFHDILQYSDIPSALKTPALAETGVLENPLVVNFDKPRPVSAIGIGNTDGSGFTVTFDDKAETVFRVDFAGNGLYLMPAAVTASRVIITHNARFAGRVAAGRGIEICTTPQKEPGWASTSQPRVTLSGQVVPGIGGYVYRTLSLDSRYRVGEAALREIAEGQAQIGAGYPFFIDLGRESYKLPYQRMYAEEKDQRSWSFESGVLKYAYSKRWTFTERF